MSLLIEKLKVYAPPLAIIITWWTLAFFPKNNQLVANKQMNHSIKHSVTESSFVENSISINRDMLKQALSGDIALITKLIAEWDIDAQLLQEKGHENIERQLNKDFLRAQLIGRALLSGNNEEIYRLQMEIKQNEVADSLNNKISLDKTYQRFLPQTYTSASFLLALLLPSQIVALPKRLREQIEIYPKSLTDAIPLDVDRYNSERLFAEKPEIAFVAHYSLPTTCETLKDQGLQLYTMQDLKDLQTITKELINIGQLVNRPLEAELLSLFVNAASIMLDNKLAVVLQRFQKSGKIFPKVLYVNYHHNFSTPAEHTLTGYFLQKISDLDISLQYSNAHGLEQMWTVPIDLEHIVNLDPNCLIIVTQHPETTEDKILNDPAFKSVKAITSGNLFFIDESIQQSPSQFSVLAYNDLIQVLERIQ